jgi:hypothetical protein
MSLPFFKPIKHLWRFKLERKPKCFHFDYGGEFTSRTLMHFVNYMEIFVNLQIFIPHKKLEFLNKKIGF